MKSKVYFVFFALYISMVMVLPQVTAYSDISYITLNNKPLAKYEQTFADNELVYYQTDNLGNIRSEFNENGSLNQVVDYLPFGSQPDGTNDLTGEIGFKSMVYDYVTELYSTYDPNLGRYLVPDTGFSMTDSQSFASYNYQRGNPYRNVNTKIDAPGLKMQSRQDGVEGSSVSGKANRGSQIGLELAFVSYDPSAVMAAGRAIGSMIGKALKDDPDPPGKDEDNHVEERPEWLKRQNQDIIDDQGIAPADFNRRPVGVTEAQGHHAIGALDDGGIVRGDVDFAKWQEIAAFNNFKGVAVGDNIMQFEIFNAPGNSGFITVPAHLSTSGFDEIVYVSCALDSSGNCPR